MHDWVMYNQSVCKMDIMLCIEKIMQDQFIQSGTVILENHPEGSFI